MEDQERILEDRIEDLAREIIRTINEAEVPGRPGIRGELKDYAIGLLQDAGGGAEPVSVEPAARGAAPFNPLGMAIPLFCAAAVMVFLFPPVGLMLLVAAGVMVVWGVVATLVSRG